jgi:two-component system LytT family response regulator
MIKALIIEDEPGNVRIMYKLLEVYCPQVDICGDAGNVDTALELIKKTKPELIFLDIEMPGGNAFTLLDKLKPLEF